MGVHVERSINVLGARRCRSLRQTQINRKLTRSYKSDLLYDKAENSVTLFIKTVRYFFICVRKTSRIIVVAHIVLRMITVEFLTSIDNLEFLCFLVRYCKVLGTKSVCLVRTALIDAYF